MNASSAAPTDTITPNELVTATTTASTSEPPPSSQIGTTGTARLFSRVSTVGSLPSRAVAYRNRDSVANPALNVLIAVNAVTISMSTRPDWPIERWATSICGYADVSWVAVRVRPIAQANSAWLTPSTPSATSIARGMIVGCTTSSAFAVIHSNPA